MGADGDPHPGTRAPRLARRGGARPAARPAAGAGARPHRDARGRGAVAREPGTGGGVGPAARGPDRGRGRQLRGRRGRAAPAPRPRAAREHAHAAGGAPYAAGERRAHGARAAALSFSPRLTLSSWPAGRALSLAQALEITLRRGAQPLARQGPRPRCIEDVLEGSRDQHLPDARVARRSARHAVQHRKAAADEPSRGAVLLDGAGEVLPEAGVEEVIVVPDLEAGFGEEVGEISLQVLVQTLKAGKVAVSRHFALLHFSATPRSPQKMRRREWGSRPVRDARGAGAQRDRILSAWNRNSSAVPPRFVPGCGDITAAPQSCWWASTSAAQARRASPGPRRWVDRKSV